MILSVLISEGLVGAVYGAHGVTMRLSYRHQTSDSQTEVGRVLLNLDKTACLTGSYR